jgi:hypothetical protein
MTQRTAISRNALASDNAGGFDDDWITVTTDTHCRGYPLRIRSGGGPSIGAVEEAGGGLRPGVYEFTGVLVPKGTDVQEGDRLEGITDRRGNVIFPGPMMVDAVGELIDHRRLTIRKIT